MWGWWMKTVWLIKWQWPRVVNVPEIMASSTHRKLELILVTMISSLSFLKGTIRHWEQCFLIYSILLWRSSFVILSNQQISEPELSITGINKVEFKTEETNREAHYTRDLIKFQLKRQWPISRHDAKILIIICHFLFRGLTRIFRHDWTALWCQ